MPGLNDLLSAKSTQRGQWNSYNEQKQKWASSIRVLVAARRILPIGPAYFSFLFIEPTKRRDPDNIVAGGVKLILDSLVGAEVLEGDGWGSVLGLASYWIHEPDRAGCLVHADPWHTPRKDSMIELLEKERK